MKWALDESSYASGCEKQTVAISGRIEHRHGAHGAEGPAIGPMSTDRLDELRAQALHARQRYDLYQARCYGPRATSPSRLRELERQSAQADAALRFAQDEAKRDAAKE